ncbi:hypothetical protein FJZ33_10385, partial [Candidatus Poribacteria bacterium]|nr:hypothetical protein [Candidatus Poribacteria bacterium]
RGSQIWKVDFRPGEGWNFRQNQQGAKIWCGDLPEEWFIGYNPFMTPNFSSEYTTFTRDWSLEEIHSFMLKRGMVFADGYPLKQVFRPYDLANTDRAFWVEDSGLRIYFRLPKDANPNDCVLEVTNREQVFAPIEQQLGYIKVSGFHFEHAADGIPVPQRAMVSGARGHHWIIEDNYIRWANACGIDVGNETWHRERNEKPESSGHHIIRRNHVSDCGICGIAAVGNNAHTLVEDNTVERIGYKDLERIWETGGLKFHTCQSVLIRRNVFRHIRYAPGLWLDYLNKNCRVTGNIFADIESIHGGIYIEVSHHINAVDHNILWDIRGTGRTTRAGYGIDIDTGEECIVANNLLGRIRDWYAISVNLDQSSRVVGGRVGLCRRHRVMNNIFYNCPKRIMLSRVEDNQSDANLFDLQNEAISLCIEQPPPMALLNLDAWQEYYGLDKNSKKAQIKAEFDPETLQLTIAIEGEIPECKEIPELHNGGIKSFIGPIELIPGKYKYIVKAGK